MMYYHIKIPMNTYKKPSLSDVIFFMNIGIKSIQADTKNYKNTEQRTSDFLQKL